MKFVFASYIRSDGYKRPQDWLQRLAAYLGVLESLAVDNEVVSIEQTGHDEMITQNGVQYHFKNFGRRISYFPSKLHRFIRSQDPDVVLIHGTSFPWQVIQLRRHLGKGVKIIVQNHNNTLPKGFKKILYAPADKAIDAYFFTSASIADEWIKHKLISSAAKLKEVMVGSSVFKRADKPAARDQLGLSSGPMYLWVGNLDQNKDPLLVIRTFRKFAAHEKDAKLYMIYQDEKLLNEIVEELSGGLASENIILVGGKPHHELGQWFNAADFFISGSYREVFGAAAVEAMSCDCIPLLTDIPSFRKITANGSFGFLYPAGNEHILYELLCNTKQMEGEEFIGRMRTHFETELSFHAIAQRIQNICAEL